MVSNKPFQTMLACDATEADIERVIARDGFVYASYKLDGIRAWTWGGKAYTRSNKLVPNASIQQYLSQPALNGFDGEIVVGKAYGEGVFARTSSGVMSYEGTPDFSYHVFECPFEHTDNAWFEERLPILQELCASAGLQHRLRRVEQFPIKDLRSLRETEESALGWGYEGLILKSPRAPYKTGRSTLREGWMLKLKRFRDAEAVVVDFVELMHNANTLKQDERGYAKRSSERAGQVPAGVLGALTVQDLQNGSWLFNIGTGFDWDTRKRIWDNREAYKGRLVKYKYLSVGVVDLPRHPVFLGFRDPKDL